MVEEQAKIRVSVKDGIFELEGPQGFVEKQIENFGDLIKSSLHGRESTGQHRVTVPPHDKPDIQPKDPPATSLENPYPTVFAIKDNKVQILTDTIPGDNDKDKTVNAALLTALGYEIAGQTEVSFDVVREVCKLHGCLNVKNFSSYMKGEQRLFVFGGTARKQTAQLTSPGRIKAKEEAEKLKLGPDQV